MKKNIKAFLLSVKWSLLFYVALFIGLIWVNHSRITEDEAIHLAKFQSAFLHPYTEVIEALDYGFSYSITLVDKETKEEWNETIMVFPYFFEQGKKQLNQAMNTY